VRSFIEPDLFDNNVLFNQLCKLRPVVCSHASATFGSLSANATKTLVQAFISCRLDYATHCCMASAMDYFIASSQCRMRHVLC